MTPPPSMRGRLSAALAMFALAWGVAVSAAVGLVVQHEADELLDNTLQESAEVLLGLLTYHAGRLPLGAGGAMPAPVHDEHLVWQIVGADGRVLLRSHRAPDTALVPPHRTGHSAPTDWHVYALPFQPVQGLLVVAQRGDGRTEAQLSLVGYTVAAALLVGLLGVIALRLRLRQELEPITALSQAVQRYDPLQPGAALDVPARAELTGVHHAVCDLGSRLSRHVAAERAFAAHAAHALRTPLASIETNLAAAQRLAPADEAQALQRARQAARRLSTVVGALLAMFRSGGDTRRESVPLGDLLAQLPVQALAIEADDTATLHADADLLAAALMNLLDNAQRQGARHVRIEVVHEAAVTRLDVCDDGPGIPADERQRLQAGLDAQDHAALPGLGLVLADLVARAHGGRLRLRPDGPGCCVELTLAPGTAGAAGV